MKNTVVIVTGAAGNLGRAVAARLAADGRCVIAVDRETGPLEAVLASLAAGNHVAMAGVNLLEATACDAMVRDAMKLTGRIDAVVHTVGGFAMGNIASADTNQFESMFRLNALTTANVFRAATPPMQAASAGCMIALGANPGLKAPSGLAAYAASKAAVHRIGESFADELKSAHVRVSAILPSIIDTPQNRASMPDADHTTWVSPDSLADTIAFLLRDGGRDVTGALIPVTGRV